MDTPETRKLTENEFKEKLAKMLKDGNIRLADVPKRIREDVARQAFGRYPLKDFSQLELIVKSIKKEG